jgi:hypothetical protein
VDFDPSTRKLYVLVRADLPPGAQIAQASHAFIEFGFRHPEIYRSWWIESNHVCILSVPDEATLLGYSLKCYKKGLNSHQFHEPDLDFSCTAVAIEPGIESAKLVSELRLALAPPRKKRRFRRTRRQPDTRQ